MTVTITSSLPIYHHRSHAVADSCKSPSEILADIQMVFWALSRLVTWYGRVEGLHDRCDMLFLVSLLRRWTRPSRMVKWSSRSVHIPVVSCPAVILAYFSFPFTVCVLNGCTWCFGLPGVLSGGWWSLPDWEKLRVFHCEGSGRDLEGRSCLVNGCQRFALFYDLVILCRKATSSCYYSRVKRSHLKLRNSMDSLLCLESKTSTELLRFGELAALRKLPFRQAGCHEQSSRPVRTWLKCHEMAKWQNFRRQLKQRGQWPAERC